MEELQERLIELMNAGGIYRGFLTKIYDLNIFSSDYLRKVKRGEQNFDDSKPNRKGVRKLIKACEKELKKYNVTT